MLLMALGSVLVACKDKTPEPTPVEEEDVLRVTVQPTFGSEYLYLDSVYTTVEGYDVKFTNLQFFMENMQGSNGQIKDVALFSYVDSGVELFDGSGVPADASTWTANLGVSVTLNHSDPSAFPNSSPLNILNAGAMHWDWNPGYIFAKIEAKVDTIQDGNALFDHQVVLHVGLDENLQTLQFTNCNWQQLSNHLFILPLKLDLAVVLQNGTQTIDLKHEYTSHSMAGQEALTLKVLQNLKAAISTM